MTKQQPTKATGRRHAPVRPIWAPGTLDAGSAVPPAPPVRLPRSDPRLLEGGQPQPLPDGEPWLLSITAVAAYLFLSERTGRPYSPDSVTAAFGRWRRALGIAHLHPHNTRHTYATGYLLGGGDIAVLSALLGHSALNTTLGYAHLRDTAVVVELQGRSSPVDARLLAATTTAAQNRASGQQTLAGDVYARHAQAIRRLRRAK